MTADTVGGVFQYALELCAGLSKQGVEVTLATMGSPLSASQRDALATIRPAIRPLHGNFKLEWMDDPWDDVDRAGAWLLDIAHRTKPDLVHINGYAHAALSFDCPVAIVAHSCVVSRWQAVRRSPVPASFDEYKRRVSQGIEAATVVVAPSGAMMDAILRNYPPPRRVAVVYHGRNPEDFFPSHKHPFVLALGRLWDEGKNLELLDQIASNVSWPILVGGSTALGDTRSAPFRRASYIGRAGGVALRALLSRASIYSLPARYEPFGLSILEAALSGAALVLGDIPSLREIWGDAALYVDPEDAAAWSSSLRRLIVNRTLLSEMADKARFRSLRYTASAMVAGYSSIYDEILGGAKQVDRPMGARCA
jgi:glycosyltransferase involved in cell wall biosynthesis